LLMTHADQALAQGELENTLAHVRQNFAYQFNKIMPIATPSAIASRLPDGTVDKPMMQKSGGLTLISSILRQLDIGLQATVDQAEMLVKTYKDAPAAEPVQAPTPKAEPVAAPEAVAPVADEKIDPTNVVEMTTAQPVNAQTTKPAPRPRVKSKLVAVETSTPAAKPTPKAAPEAAAAAPAPKKPRPGFMPKARTAKIIPRAKPETCDAYDEAIAYLTKQGRALTQDMANNDDMAPNDLMNASADHIMWLSEYLEDLTKTNLLPLMR